MSIDFAQSETKINLMRAFAGESQARNRYTFAAGLARDKNPQVIEGIFLFTANQEKEHGEIYYHLLKQVDGENIPADGSYPVDLTTDIVQALRSAQHNEYQEWEHEYSQFAQIAREEGFPEIGKTFEDIAAIERIHGNRFGRYADMLENGSLFVSDVSVQWMCLNCGHIVEAAMAPALCPVCSHGQGYFIRFNVSPYQ